MQELLDLDDMSAASAPVPSLAGELDSLGFVMQPDAPVAPIADVDEDLMGLLSEMGPPSPQLITPSNQDFAAELQLTSSQQAPLPFEAPPAAAANPFEPADGPTATCTPAISNPFDILVAEAVAPSLAEPPLDDDDALEDLLAFAADL